MRNALLTRLWLLLPALLALVWFSATLQHGFRSDDFLSVYYFDRDAETVHWGRVFEEWARPWFGVRDLYRPLVSLSFGGNWALSSSPFGFHMANVLMLCGTATFVAAAAARLAPRRKVMVGLVAGALVVLHPAAVEPTAWIAARTTGLQVFWSAVAYWSFLRWRGGDGRVWLPLLATALACASKEGAVLLPVSFVCLDLVRGSRLQWRVHAPFWLLVGGYLVFRKLLLGWFTTAEEGHTIAERLHNAWALFEQLLAPPIRDGHGFGGWIFLLMFALVGAVLLGPGTVRAFWCLPWAALLLLPGTTHVVLSENELAGRFVFDAVPALALFVALALGRASITWWDGLRLVALVALTVALTVGFSLASVAWLARYDDEAAHIHAAQNALRVAAANAEPGRPFGVVGLPGLPLLQPALWGFLTQRPFAERDLSVVGLANILVKDPAAANVFADATVIHALVAEGAGCGVWDPAKRVLVPIQKAARGVVEFVQDPTNPRRFLPPRLLPPTAVAALEVVSPTPVQTWLMRVLGNLDGPYAFRPFASSGGDPRTTWWNDATQVLPWLVAATLGGGPAGVELECDGAAPPAGTTVRAHAALPRVELSEDVPRVVPRAELERWLRWPLAGDQADFQVYLLLPTSLHSIHVGKGGNARLDMGTRSQLDFACDVLGPCRVHWVWQSQEPDGGPPRRTGFGTCIVL